MNLKLFLFHFSGMGKHIAALAVSSILDTFSNNDYINILSYNVTTRYVVPCFENLLVQATRENIEIFNKAVQELVPDEKSNLIDALELGFELLENVNFISVVAEWHY